MSPSRITSPVVSAIFLAALAACATATKNVTESNATEAIQGVPEACFVRRGVQPAAPAQPSVPVVAPAQPSAPTAVPVTEILRCASDVECGAGARCDTALSPPSCVTLYCVPEKGACSSAEQCSDGMQCHAGLCNPCNLCGSLCAVSFDTDPKNCGGCGKTISAAQKCIGGEATCPSDRPTLCGGECVNTSTDLRHCGACNKAAPSGGSCTKGKTACGADLEVCGGTCADTKKEAANCGACGHVCPGDLTCSEGYCYKPLQKSAQETCFSICQAGGLRCAGAAAVFTSTTQPAKFVDLTCGALPGAPPAGFTFNSMSCACVER